VTGGNQKSLAEISLDLCRELPSPAGFFFEAGAHDGESQSNTHQLELQLGWTGVLVEPSKQFQSLKLNRPGNTLFNVALTEREQPSVRGLFHGNLGDTAASDLVSLRQSTGQTRSVWRSLRRARNRILRRLGIRRGVSHKQLVTVEAKTLDEVVSLAKTPNIDFLSLDLEGMELPVMRGFSFSIRPRIMVIETRLGDHLEMTHILIKHGYRLAGVFPPEVTVDGKDSRIVHSNGIWVDFFEEGLFEKLVNRLTRG